jgi:hypothetical protein
VFNNSTKRKAKYQSSLYEATEELAVILSRECAETSSIQISVDST